MGGISDSCNCIQYHDENIYRANGDLVVCSPHLADVHVKERSYVPANRDHTVHERKENQ